ncbi:MAG: NADH-quinone oxidoreductase subunit J [Chloroflexi bacterium]|nr:NADH-quinone oxidoreductase subunit J [Chloroflexota bacterium]MDL1883307.1 NADH-quinone oxidoreductase subunit J [Anaerolineae bacterium CFX8]
MIELNVQTIAFLICALFILGGGLGVVTTRNLIHATLYLILSLFGVAGFFVLLSAPFLAAVQVLVYIGAIAILIIFAVMLTRSMTQLRQVYNHQWTASAVVSGLLFALLVVGVILPVWGINGAQAVETVSEVVADTVDLGKALVDRNQYVLPFEVASLLLTAAMIGAIVIARDDE